MPLNQMLHFKDEKFELVSLSRLQSVKTASAQDVNTASAVLLTFNANDFSIGSDISHSSGSSDFTINTTGVYEVSFNISFLGSSSRRIPRLSVYVDGVENVNTRAYGYTRNSTDDTNTSSLPPFPISLTATDVITIRGTASGDSGTVNTILSECWVRIKRIT